MKHKLKFDPEAPVITRCTPMDDDIAAQMAQRFIAFDVETTGLDTHAERIVELCAVLFENGVPTAEFSTLVNPGVPMPAQVRALKDLPVRHSAVCDRDAMGPAVLKAFD